MNKMFKYFSERFTNIFPIGGGSAGAIYQMNSITSYFPTWEVIVSTIIVGIIGACIGYGVKLALDYIFRNFKERNHLK